MMSKNRTLILFLLFVTTLIILPTRNSKPCTGFAVYSGNTYYGLNLDWYNTEMRFNILNVEGYKFFQMEFLYNGNWLQSCRYNEMGMLGTYQEVRPLVTANILQNEIPADLGMIIGVATQHFASADTVIRWIEETNQRVVEIPGWGLHSLLSSKDTAAYVVEVGADSNMFTAQENGFLVMTNFNNHFFWGMSYNQVTGLGSSRYITAYEYISDHYDNFSYEDAWEVLSRVKQSGGSVRTRCSMVFDPANNDIYVVLHRNFSKVIRISLDEGFWETYSGYEHYVKMNIGINGVLASELQTLTSVDASNTTEVPEQYSLLQNYPNPFNPSTTISFDIPEESQVMLSIYNTAGEEMDVVVNRTLGAGKYNYAFNAAGLPSGIYFYRLKANDFIETRKMILLR